MRGKSPRQTVFADYVGVLSALNQKQADALIVGGHAVNFWAEIFEEHEAELRQYRPFTSVDLDVHRLSLAGVQFLRAQSGQTEDQRDPFGKPFTIVNNTFFIKNEDGKTLPVDNLKMVDGLRPDEVLKGAMRVEFSGVTLQVLNPIICLKAKLHNVAAIDQERTSG